MRLRGELRRGGADVAPIRLTERRRGAGSEPELRADPLVMTAGIPFCKPQKEVKVGKTPKNSEKESP
jgi:hypothetical protein